MTQAFRNLLVICTALVPILSFAGAHDQRIKKIQVQPSLPDSGAQMFKEYCAA